MTITSSILLLTSIAWFAKVAQPFPWTDWYLENAPDSWIAWHAEKKQTAWADRALAQWLKRYRFSRLSAPHEARLFDYLLKWQNDGARRWDPAMGELLYNALLKDNLSPAQAEEMMRGTFSNLQVKVRPAIRVGDVVPFEQTWTYRGGIIYHNWSFMRGCFIHFDEPPVATRHDTYGWGSGGYGAGPYTWREYPEHAGSDHIAPGPHRLHVLIVQLLGTERRPSKPLSPPVEYRRSFDVQVLPAGTPIGEPFSDAKSAQAVASAIHVGIYHWADGRIFAECGLEKTPVDRAFDVYVEYEGNRHWIARRSAKAGQPTMNEGNEFVPIKDSPDIKQMKMILVGSGDALAESVDQQKYWNGTIEFPAVPLLPYTESLHASHRPKLPHQVKAD
jgi:hypothetical protein